MVLARSEAICPSIARTRASSVASSGLSGAWLATWDLSARVSASAVMSAPTTWPVSVAIRAGSTMRLSLRKRAIASRARRLSSSARASVCPASLMACSAARLFSSFTTRSPPSSRLSAARWAERASKARTRNVLRPLVESKPTVIRFWNALNRSSFAMGLLWGTRASIFTVRATSRTASRDFM
ncbi:hypothetical protein D3C85_1064350 [compost metagenome]